MIFDDNFLKKFWERVDIKEEDECWEWLGNIHKTGYGTITYQGKNYKAHRLSFMISNNYFNITPEIKICHKCDNKKCCNPFHLFSGSQKDNIYDMENKGRAVHPKGSKNGMAKINENIVIEIRTRYATTSDSQKTIAKDFNIEKSMVGYIINGKNWKDAGGPISIGNKRKSRIVLEKNIDDIKNFYLSGYTQKEIADMYNIGQASVGRIIRNGGNYEK